MVLENIYPDLPSEDKHQLRTAKYNFYKEGLGVSKARMMRVLNEYGELVTLYEYKIEKK